MTTPDLDRLYAQWSDLLASCGATTGVDLAFARIVARYGEPHRHYHTLVHVEAVVGWVRELGAGLSADELLGALLAGWLHDVVYDPRSAENEERSAVLAETLLTECGVRPPLVAECARLVRATATHTSSTPADRVLMDADLAILAAPAADYQRYAGQIRDEYDWVPEADYRAGRTRILRDLLDRGADLFTSHDGRFDLEQVRHNIEGELASLEVRA